jgi:hypothetical protein
MVPLGFGRPRAFQVDVEHLFLDATAPITPIYLNNDAWTGGDRCTLDSTTPLFRAPVPTDYVGKPARTDYRPNSSAAFLAADNITIIQTQPLTRCTAGGRITSGFLYIQSNVTIYGGGRGGAHGGSLLSAIGGTLRAHEFRPVS